MAAETAKFGIVLDDQVSGAAEDAADSIEALRKRMSAGQDTIKQLNSQLRNLAGKSQDVTKAKELLRAKINAEKDALSKGQLALLKNADATKRLDERTKALSKAKAEAEERAKRLGSAISNAGGPVAMLRDKFNALSDLVGGGGKAALVTGFAALTAAAAALTVALVAGLGKLGSFILGAANAARSAGLLREAVAGSALNADALGTQVDALARKLPTAKGALNELAVSLAKGGIQGQTLVDTFNAVGQASSALGDDVGSKLREFVERGRLSQVFAISPQELQGTGLAFEDIAQSLAKQMRVGVDKARAALVEGRVKLADGAAAMRKAVEDKFGNLNLRKMLDLNVLAAKFKERLASLTSGVKLDKLLVGLNQLTMLFDESTVTGQGIKSLITLLGNGLGATLQALMPLAKGFFQGMVIATLQLTNAALRLYIRFKDSFGANGLLKDVSLFNLAIDAGKAALYGVVALVGVLGVAAAALAAPFLALQAIFVTLPRYGEELGTKIREFFLNADWKQLGTAIVTGLIDGLKAGARKLADAVTGLGHTVRKAFENKLEIGSPSKVFEEYGANTVEGYQRGIEGSTPEAAQALNDMASAPKGGGRGGVTINLGGVTFAIAPGANAEQVKQAVSDPSFLDEFFKMLERQMLSSGVPT